MNAINQPYINPLKFQQLNPTDIPQYISKHMDDNFFVDTIREWEQPVRFCQHWLTADAIRLQFITNYSPVNLLIKNTYGATVYSVAFQTLQQDEFNPGNYIRQCDLDLSIFSEGHYYAQVNVGSFSLVSEPFQILETAPDDSLLIEYSHYETYQGVIFDSPFAPSIRVSGILKYLPPGSKDTIYEDQSLNESILRSVPYRIWQFVLGGKKGVPPWFADKIFRILGCSSLKIDGRFYTKNEGSGFETNELEGYPMAGWKIELREKLSRGSLVYENDSAVIGQNSMMAVIGTKGFGLNDDGNDYIEIEDIN